MHPTKRQQDASRVNGSKSKGPVTPEGKDRSSKNATRHGLFSDSILLEPENREAWTRMAEDLVARFQPADNVERAIIHDMAVTQWRKERAQNIEAALIGSELDTIVEPADEARRIALAWANAIGRHKALDDLSKQTVRLGNYWMRLHKKLKELQADRKAAESEKALAEAVAAIDKRYSENEPGAAQDKRMQRDRVWERNFRKIFDEMVKVAHRHPGLGKDLALALANIDPPELW